MHHYHHQPRLYRHHHHRRYEERRVFRTATTTATVPSTTTLPGSTTIIIGPLPWKPTNAHSDFSPAVGFNLPSRAGVGERLSASTDGFRGYSHRGYGTERAVRAAKYPLATGFPLRPSGIGGTETNDSDRRVARSPFRRVGNKGLRPVPAEDHGGKTGEC